MDQDRHIGPQEVGRASVSLKEAKQTLQVFMELAMHLYSSRTAILAGLGIHSSVFRAFPLSDLSELLMAAHFW